ncbi:MAG: hypothetical protein KGO51_02795 [Alphaproteobacteria bacterium]|nr:hypothetical protein [Alphaproteobacteria bacterium]
MANRDQGWGHRGRHGQHDRWRRDDEHHRAEHDRPWEERTFGQAGGLDRREDRDRTGPREPRWEGGEPWRGEARYGARYDQDRTGYGGQEYGMEGGREHDRRDDRRASVDRDERETWRPDRGEPYGDLELNPRNRGVQEFGPPSDYAYHPQAGHEFDPDYLHWREEQMRSHDRDYHDWRRDQRQAYDDDYRRFRDERREHFGRTFQDWRAQRSTADGVRSVTVMPGAGGPSGGSGGYGADAALPGGYATNSSDKPSGMPEPFTAMNASPAAGQTGGQTRAGSDGPSRPGDSSPEFGKEPPQVQAASGGWDARGAPEARTEAARDPKRKDEKRDDERR